MTGLQAAAETLARTPRMRVLMLSMYDNEQYFFAALKAGASGYVLKSVADRELVEAAAPPCAASRSSTPAPSRTLVRDYLDRIRRGGAVPDQILTPREDEVVKLIAEGHSSKEIAALLVISVKTVERHRANILAKLGMRDRTELTRYAIRAGLIEP